VKNEEGELKMKSGIKFLGLALAVGITFAFAACKNPFFPAGKEGKGHSFTIEQVRIPAATFTMGSPTNEPGRAADRETQHQVTLTKGFYMGKYPVTQGQYEAVMGNNPSYFKTPVAPETNTANRPVETVSWYDALVFCNKLSMLEGLTPAYSIVNSTNPSNWGSVPTEWGSPTKDAWDAVVIVDGSTGYRLPTEAQWEYACRAGTTTAFNWGTNYIDDSKANYNAGDVDEFNTVAGTSLERTTAVGSYAPNAYGLYDMHGNVYEWCWDWFDENYGSAAGVAITDPMGASSGSFRVIRGGSWYDSVRSLRSAVRYYTNTHDGYFDLGFRILRPAQ
jgi:formylglycine-generating enzyme required for sulfatase activity